MGIVHVDLELSRSGENETVKFASDNCSNGLIASALD